MTTVTAVDALVASGSYRSRAPRPIRDVTGAIVGELSCAPAPVVSRAVGAAHRAGAMSVEGRRTALLHAAELFATVVDGIRLDDHERTVSRVSGLGIGTVRAASRRIAQGCRDAWDEAHYARPRGAVDDWRAPAARRGTALWVRRGDVLTVLAAGNHPALHAGWLVALALGYRVVVRPSGREPFTPWRLVSALRQAGFGSDQVLLLPTDHTGADAVFRGGDLALVYGGDAVIRKYAQNPYVMPRGPGRSKVLLGADSEWPDYVELIVDSVTRGGGVGCTNATGLLVEGDVQPVAEAIAGRLSAIPSRRPLDEDALLPVQTLAGCERLREHLSARAAGAESLLGADHIVDDLGDGSAALRPALYVLESAQDARLGAEMPFPCLWVAPWSRSDGAAALGDTLVLTAVTGDEDLIDDLAAARNIRNIYVGDCATPWTAPQVPHDDYLPAFLMTSKGAVVRT